MSYFQWVSVKGGFSPALQPDQFKETLRVGAKPFEVVQAQFAPLFIFTDWIAEYNLRSRTLAIKEKTDSDF